MLTTPTHEVTNQPEPLVGYNAFDADLALGEALEREGGSWGIDRVRDLGAVAGSEQAREHGRRAERNEPRLETHDRYGHRIDRIDYDPSWHWLVGTGGRARAALAPVARPAARGTPRARGALLRVVGGPAPARCARSR